MDWGTIDKDMYFYAGGFNDVWKNQSWERCDFIYGIDNVDEQHWMAYRYNLIEKTVQIYDSMLKGMKQARATVAGRHAAIAPSLYNVNVAKDEDKLDPDVPFKIEYIADVPQQRNGYDCGIYAVKIVQCLVMEEPYVGLEEMKFPDYRKKMATDLVKWVKGKGKGTKLAYEQQSIPVTVKNPKK